MNPIDELFQNLRKQGRPAFMPFLTAGDPDIETTHRLVETVINAGADLVEIGFPYSDAIADGPVIQASYTRALSKGLHIEDVFTCIRGLTTSTKAPMVGMLSYTLVHRRGPEAFFDKAQESGLSGAIIPDLPFEESGKLREMAAARDFKLIHLVTPTTSRDRAREIARASTGFLYCVSVTGITGERETLPEALIDQLHWLREQTEVPLCAGFGISKPEDVTMLRDHVDGVIVGSALVRHLEQIGHKSVNEVAAELSRLTQSLVGALTK